MIAMRSPVGTCAVLAFALLLTSCGRSGEDSGTPRGTRGDADAKVTRALDTARAVSRRLVAASGGVISAVTSEGTSISVVFPEASLDKDIALVLTPLSAAPAGDTAVVVPGFSIEESGTGRSPLLKSPVLVTMVLAGSVRPHASIVRYHDTDGGYDVMPTTVRTTAGVSTLRATVSHFTTFGGRVLPPEDRATVAGGDEFRDYNWVIYINDHADVINGPMKSVVYLDLRAVNASGDIDGTFEGTATSRTTNEMTAGGGSMSAPFVSTFGRILFVMASSVAAGADAPRFNRHGKPIEPAPPQFNRHGKPIPPETDQVPEWRGEGSLSVTSRGTGTVTAGGQSASTSLGTQATLPYEVEIVGASVSLIVTMPQGKLIFNGHIQGERKRP